MDSQEKLWLFTFMGDSGRARDAQQPLALAPSEAMLAEMADWWENQVGIPGSEYEVNDTERRFLDALMAPLISRVARRAFCEAHGIEPDSEVAGEIIARSCVLYAYLLGAGRLSPAPPPISHSVMQQLTREDEIVSDIATAIATMDSHQRKIPLSD